jgi:hypothetical protein
MFKIKVIEVNEVDILSLFCTIKRELQSSGNIEKKWQDGYEQRVGEDVQVGDRGLF